MAEIQGERTRDLKVRKRRVQKIRYRCTKA